MRSIKSVLLHAGLLKLRSQSVKNAEVFALKKAREEITTHLATLAPQKVRKAPKGPGARKSTATLKR